ncbi:MAG: hypothetical protein VX723_02025 [Candidatus Thermoplasmatota archaeon]|nr:hypothetical protein [Candidatus Thermoplasmatota archaeon]
MTMQGTDWEGSLSRPSQAISTLAMALGAWVVLLTLVNISIGAYSPGFKVLWIGFISGDSAASNIPHDGAGVVMDDIVFALIGAVLLVLGSMGMKKCFDGGVMEWFRGLPNGPVTTSLLTSENGIRRTMASWMIAIGAIFYLSWSFLNTTWVDPGVYAVMIILVSFGFGIHTLEDSA